MAESPNTLVVDDGELTDVRAALEDLGIQYQYVRGSAIDGVELPIPSELLVVTARRAMVLDNQFGKGKTASEAPAAGREPVRIVVVTEDSTTLRNMLRNLGFDYLIRRPVHPAALRLLLLRALYHGPERRIARRMPIGSPVSYRTGFRRRSAILAELAVRGCRLLTDRIAEPDTRITVHLPKSLTEDRPFSLPGWVVRCDPDTTPEGKGKFCVAVAFEVLPSQKEKRLRSTLRSKSKGPETLSSDDVVESASNSAQGSDERRSAERREFRQPIVALQNAAERALVGRNLSTGGMLVAPTPDLAVGDEVRIAIFGKPREEPVLVNATVVRDDGERGLGLRFNRVDENAAADLESLVASLPAVERLVDSEVEAMGTVMAEILSTDDD